MPWQFWLMLLGIVVMFFGGGVGTAGKGGAALVLFMTGFGMSIAGGVMMPDAPLDRASAARATIAAATATAIAGTAESEPRALEREASVAATAAASEGVGR